jgi:hypothetical protein
VVADVIGAESDAALIELAGRAHGSPFYVVELLRGLLDALVVALEHRERAVADARGRAT